MYNIDKIAATSPLKGTHPGEKAAFSLLSLLMVLISSEPLLPTAVFCSMMGSLLLKGKVSPGKLVQLLLIPGAFILTSLLTILVSVSPHPFPGARALGGGWLYGGITREGGITSLQILLKSLSGVSCFYFLILTTPVGQIDFLLSRMRISPFFREMMILVYRYIFLLSELAGNIWNAQKIRHGYSGFGRSLRSMGMLSVSVLEKTGTYSDQAGLALEARGGEGICIQFLQPAFRGNPRNRILLALFLAGLALLRFLEELWPILN